MTPHGLRRAALVMFGEMAVGGGGGLMFNLRNVSPLLRSRRVNGGAQSVALISTTRGRCIEDEGDRGHLFKNPFTRDFGKYDKVMIGNVMKVDRIIPELNRFKFHTSAVSLNPKENEAAIVGEKLSGSSPKGQPAPSRVEKTVNHITLMGRVGGDPQMRGTTEHPVVVFSIATHANYNYQSGELLQKTDWHRVCVFKPYLRDTVYKYMTKGQRVYVTGRISYGEITDDQGKAHTTTSIIADDVIFISDSRNRAPEA